MTITTAMCVTFKTELFGAAHCLQANPGAVTGTFASASTSVTSVSSLSGVVIGMGIAATNIPASTTVVAMPTTASLTLSAASTGIGTGATLTFSGDAFLMALIKSSPGRSYGATTTNYTDLTASVSDEVANGGGYTTTGFALTNVSPANDGASIAYATFSANPQWTSATFSTDGCLVYNSSKRMAGVGGRAVSVHSFNGTQTVSNGNLTIILPTNDSTHALLRLS